MTAIEIIPQPDQTETALAQFDQIEAAIAELKTQADAITVIDHTDKENATKARNLRLMIKPTRIQADNIRKETKAPFLKLCDVIEKKGQSIIKPLDAIERELKTKEEIVSKHAEREAEKERQRIAAEQEAARKQLEADQAKLDAERAEVERQRAEIEKEKADAEAKRQREADIAAAVELGKQRERLEQAQRTSRELKQMEDIAVRADYPKPSAATLPDVPSDKALLLDWALQLRQICAPPVASIDGRNIADRAYAQLQRAIGELERESANL